MRCPSGLVWDNVHKLCMESSSTCHAALASDHHRQSAASIDSYMQYFAKLASTAAAEAPAGDTAASSTLTQPRLKEHGVRNSPEN